MIATLAVPAGLVGALAIAAFIVAVLGLLPALHRSRRGARARAGRLRGQPRRTLETAAASFGVSSCAIATMRGPSAVSANVYEAVNE
jgi:hypothetical protein